MSKSKIIIGDLMGGGCNSLRLALKKAKLQTGYEVYTFDIVPQSNGYKNIVFDLSQDNITKHLDMLIKMKKIKKPDILISSPLCQSFSVAMQSVSSLKDKSGHYFSGNPHHYWNHDIKKVCRWPQKENIKGNGFSGNSYPGGSNTVPKYIGELGERCIQNIIKIICYYQPHNGYIENPALSLMGKYIEYNLGFKSGILNIAHYSAYNENFSRKPTGFLSNINLSLHKQLSGQRSIKKVDEHSFLLVLSGACKDNKKDELKRQKAEEALKRIYGPTISVEIMYKKNAMERSHIPEELLIDIIKKFTKNKKRNQKYTCKDFKLTKWSNNLKPSISKMVKEVTI